MTSFWRMSEYAFRNLTPTVDRERCRFSTCSYSMSLHNIYILRPRRKKIAKRSAEYSELIIWQTAWATCLNNSYCYETFWSHATDISSAKFCMKCLMVVSDYEKTVIVLFLRNNSAVYKFGITSNISFQARRLNFLSVLHTSWELACQQVGGMCLWNLLSCYNVLIVNCDNKRSNQRLMNFFAIREPYLPILAKSLK